MGIYEDYMDFVKKYPQYAQQVPYCYRPGFYPPPQYPGYYQQPLNQTQNQQGANPPQNNGRNGWVDFSNQNYIKGFLVAAGLTLVVTNPKVQKVMVKSAVKAWAFLQGGIEEVKEQMYDIKAEMSQED